MKKSLTISAIITAIAAIFGSAQISVAQTTQKLTATKASEYGLIYSLPNTVFDITFETRHTVSQPGEFANYARRYRGIENPITQPTHSVELVSVTLTPRGVPDLAHQWLVQFKAGSTPFMVLTADGIPLSVNTEEVKIPASPALPVAVAAQPTPLETPEAKHAITQDMIQSSSISKRAELASQRINELHDNRDDLMKGENLENLSSGRSMKFLFEQIDAQEAALTAMFAGTTSTWTEVSSAPAPFVPDSLDRVNEVLARLSPIDGIVDKDDLSGKPIYINYTIKEKGKLPVNEKGLTKTFPKGGLAYNIPGVATISITYDGRTLFSADVPVAQLGVTFGLDPSLFTDKKAPAFVQFNPITGGITELGTK